MKVDIRMCSQPSIISLMNTVVIKYHMKFFVIGEV